MVGIEALIKQRLRDIAKVSGEETKVSTHLFLDFSHGDIRLPRLQNTIECISQYYLVHRGPQNMLNKLIKEPEAQRR